MKGNFLSIFFLFSLYIFLFSHSSWSWSLKSNKNISSVNIADDNFNNKICDTFWKTNVRRIEELSISFYTYFSVLHVRSLGPLGRDKHKQEQENEGVYTWFLYVVFGYRFPVLVFWWRFYLYVFFILILDLIRLR